MVVEALLNSPRLKVFIPPPVHAELARLTRAIVNSSFERPFYAGVVHPTTSYDSMNYESAEHNLKHNLFAHQQTLADRTVMIRRLRGFLSHPKFVDDSWAKLPSLEIQRHHSDKDRDEIFDLPEAGTIE